MRDVLMLFPSSFTPLWHLCPGIYIVTGLCNETEVLTLEEMQMIPEHIVLNLMGSLSDGD